MTNNSCPTLRRIAAAFIFVLLVFVGYPVATVQAKKKTAKYGTIKIQSNPGGLPLSVDGKSFGQTSTEFRAIDLEPGVHSIVVTMPDGQLWTRAIELPAGRVKCIALNYRPGVPPPPISRCPYPVNISGPSKVAEGDVITYTAGVVYKGESPLSYKWTVSPDKARILSGAGTPTLTVDSTGLGGKRVTATLLVDDGSGQLACRQVSHVSTFVPLPPPRENPAKQFDVCYGCSYDDQKARLDNLAIELQNDPSTSAYIIAYGGRTSRGDHADRLGTRAIDYLSNKRGVDPKRIVVRSGGLREQDCVELWVVPSGAKPPQPTPTIRAGDTQPAYEAPPRKSKRG